MAELMQYIYSLTTRCVEIINNPSEYKRNVPIDLVFVQAKLLLVFLEAGMDRFCATSHDLLRSFSGDSQPYNSI